MKRMLSMLVAALMVFALLPAQPVFAAERAQAPAPFEYEAPAAEPESAPVSAPAEEPAEEPVPVEAPAEAPAPVEAPAPADEPEEAPEYHRDED